MKITPGKICNFKQNNIKLSNFRLDTCWPTATYQWGLISVNSIAIIITFLCIFGAINFYHKSSKPKVKHTRNRLNYFYFLLIFSFSFGLLFICGYLQGSEIAQNIFIIVVVISGYAVLVLEAINMHKTAEVVRTSR